MSQVQQPPVHPAPPRKRRRLLWNAAGLLVAVVAILAALCLWINSSQFANMVRNGIISQLEKATGGRVEIGHFQWRLLTLQAEADGLVIHGLEDPGDAPYAQVERLRVQLSILGFLSPRIVLRELDVLKPEVHLVVYPDGSTNQPHPKITAKRNRSAIDTLFDLKAGHVSIEQGGFHFYSRASGFDVGARYLPLELQANDAAIVVKYVPGNSANPESYHIDAGVGALNLKRGGTAPSASSFPASVHASVDLTRNAVFVRSLEIVERTRGEKERVLHISATASNFNRLRWDAKAVGQFDLHLLNPIFGYSSTPDGVARLDVSAAGDGTTYRIDGPIHVDHGSYLDSGIHARDLQVDTLVHADPELMHFSHTFIRFAQGGQLDGDLQLLHWAPHPPLRPTATLSPAPEPNPQEGARPKHFWNRKNAPRPPAPAPKSRDILVKEPETEITVNGKITSKFENLSLDTVLDIVGKQPFNRLGVDTVFNGPATANWVNGDVKTLQVDATLGMTPSGRGLPEEVSASGDLDASYSQRNGTVDVRRLELNLPETSIKAHGQLGAYPLTGATALSIDLHTDDLGEFDSTLHDLGLHRNGKAGTAALPVSLGGEADFHGTWDGSILSPQIAGSLKATQLAVELPPPPGQDAHTGQLLRWDSVEASGTYDAERIAILHGQLVHGQELISLDGTLSSAHPAPSARAQGDEHPAFDSRSLLHAHVRAAKVDTKSVFPLLGIQEPVTGTLEADFETNGTLASMEASGWVQMDDAVAWGEPVSRARVEGTLQNQVFNLRSISISSKAGTISGSGSYDLRSRHYQATARANALDLAAIEHAHQAGEAIAAKLSFSATASGVGEEAQVEGHANVTELMVDHEPLGSVELTAHTVNRRLMYDMTSRMETASLAMHGQTDLHGDFDSSVNLDFSRLDIGAIFRLAHFDTLKAESALSGTATLQGPLAHPDAFRGEARLQAPAATVSGVHLRSEGELHATLADARVKLDPVHITGEETDLRANGTLDLHDTRKLDFAASGSINLKLAETLDSDITAAGTTTFEVEAHGPLSNPSLHGRVDFNSVSLSLEDVPNGLSQLHGTLEFNQNRLEVRSLTAMTGGGQLTVGGYLAYQQGLFADLTVTGKSVRIRYPQGVSSLADTTLHLQGSKANLLLSGNVMLTRFSVSPDLDIAALTAQAGAAQSTVPSDAPSNHVRLDIRIQSSPQLNFQNAFAKLAGNVDLRLRGTMASPSLLGRISITEGNATIAGTRYDLQRGDIQFTNPVRIQPNIDLNATARVQDYDITLGLHGTPDKLSVNYRSDPPLPQSDVIALLALGRTQSEQGLYTQQQEQSAGLSPSTDVLLGGALNATVSSRVQKLFGAGSVKVDPSYLGALGVSTTRITVDEQVGKNVTLTYATNVDTSAQQLLQAEIAINRHVSVQVTRDESDVFSVVIKATRRYR